MRSVWIHFFVLFQILPRRIHFHIQPMQYNFSTNFVTAVSSTTTNVVSSDIAPISSLAPPQSLPSLSSLLFPSLPLPPRWSLIPIDSQWTDRTLAQPYVSDPADVKLERSTSPAADRSLESSTRQKQAERDIVVLRREGTTTGTTTTPGSTVSEACPSTASDCSTCSDVIVSAS